MIRDSRLPNSTYAKASVDKSDFRFEFSVYSIVIESKIATRDSRIENPSGYFSGNILKIIPQRAFQGTAELFRYIVNFN